MALVAVLAGTAVAADPAPTPLISKKKTKNIARTQANKAVDRLLPIDANELGEIDEHSESGTIAANTTGTVEADCDGDERVISGGWRDNAPPTGANLALVYEDHRTSDGWRASIRAFGTARTITVFAYCLEE
jgi:hypothetical protein